MSDHRTFLELAAQAIDFELAPADAERLRAHLAGCASCRTAAQRMRADAEALRGFGWLDAPTRVEDAVTDAALRGGRPARSAPRLWTFALVGALLVMGLAGGLLGGGSMIEQILGDRTPGPSIPPATSPTAAPASQTPLPSGLETPASPTAVPSGFGLNLAWSATTVSASGSGGARMEDVVIAGGTIVAVGEDHRDGQRRAAVWTSADGATWTETILDAGPLHAITAFGGGFVAVGDGVSARSSDGSTWSWTEWQGADGGSQIDVAAGPGGVVSLRLDADGSASIDVLLSSDGSSWRATGTLDGVCNPAIAGDATAYLIVANDCGRDPITAQIRRSLDGVTWSTVEPGDAFVPQAAPATVAAAGPGFVAGGYWRDADRIRQAFWSSPDGQSWRRRGTFAPPGGTEEIRDVAALGEGAFAVGLRDPGTASTPAAWASPDGISWARAAPLPLAAGGEPGTQTVNAVVGGDRLVVAVGWLETADGERPVAWVAPPPPAP